MTTLHTITNADGDSFLIDMSRVKIIANSKRFNGDLIIEFKEGLGHKTSGFTMDDVQAGIDKGGQEFPSRTAHVSNDGASGQTMRARGKWSLDESYLKGDLAGCPKNGETYIALVDTDKPLTNKKAWRLLFAD